MHPTLHGVVAYEDVSVAKLATEKWDYMVRTLQSDFAFELRLWKFDVLAIPELREAAVHDAAKAQIVFVATRGAGDLPPVVKGWIEEWLAQKNHQQDVPRLLTFLFDPPPGPDATAALSQFAYLQQAARRGSMDFIAATPNQRQQSVISVHASAEEMSSWEVRVSSIADEAAKRDAQP